MEGKNLTEATEVLDLGSLFSKLRNILKDLYISKRKTFEFANVQAFKFSKRLEVSKKYEE